MRLCITLKDNLGQAKPIKYVVANRLVDYGVIENIRQLFSARGLLKRAEETFIPIGKRNQSRHATK